MRGTWLGLEAAFPPASLGLLPCSLTVTGSQGCPPQQRHHVDVPSGGGDR